MKVGKRVRDLRNGNLGTSCGPVVVYHAEWIMVVWDNGTESLVIEECLEPIDDNL